jgi:phage terminase large subunit
MILPADIAAQATYDAMHTKPDYVRLAEELERTTGSVRRKLVEHATKSDLEKALIYLSRPAAERDRERRKAWMREDPKRASALKYYYRRHIADFIHDWGVTVDPRAIAEGKFAIMPFHLWPKQRELVAWMLDLWRKGRPGVVVKGRDVGASWVGMAVLVSLALFESNFAGGIASATEVKLDRSGDPDTLLYKAREFLKHLPEEFRAGFEEAKHSHFLRLHFPGTGSSITGEAGDNAGRGGRKSLYLCDEAAFFERPLLIDASLAATTNCRIDISTPHGVNAFFDRAHNDAIARIDVTWRDDPRKDQAWYDRKKEEMDPVVFAQEVDVDFYASAEGVLIPSQWVQASVGLIEKLGIEATGAKLAALDVSDVGQDRCAFAARHGVALQHVTSWSGTGSDPHATTAKSFTLCDIHGISELTYDATGVGSAVRGAARVLNETREEKIIVSEFVASSNPVFAERKVPGTNRKAKDMFLNRAAQAAWHLRTRFQESFKASKGEAYDPEMIISIDPNIPGLSKLLAELGQPQVKETATGKLQLVKAPSGTRSPNMFDAVSYVFAPRVMPLNIDDRLLASLTEAYPGQLREQAQFPA